MTKSRGRAKITRTTCNNKLKAHWDESIDDAIPEDLWLAGTSWTQGWYEALSAFCDAMPVYEDALDFMDAVVGKHRNRKLTLTNLKEELKAHKARSAAEDARTVPQKPDQGKKRPRNEHDDVDEDEDGADDEGDLPTGSKGKGQPSSDPIKKHKTIKGNKRSRDEHDDADEDADYEGGDLPTNSRREGQSPSRPKKKHKATHAREATSPRDESAEKNQSPTGDVSDNVQQGVDNDGKPEGADIIDLGDLAGDEGEESDLPDSIYCIGPSNDAGFLGRAIAKNEKLLEGKALTQRQAKIAEHEYRSAPIRGTRHVYRRITSNAELQHWNEWQRGRSTACHFDTMEEECSALLQEVEDLMRARSFLRSSDLTVMKTVDAAEGRFIQEVAQAKQSYARQLKQMRLLPRKWDEYTRTDVARHWEFVRESVEE